MRGFVLCFSLACGFSAFAVDQLDLQARIVVGGKTLPVSLPAIGVEFKSY